jgi:hypothetical protein
MLPADMYYTRRDWVERQGPVGRWTELSADHDLVEITSRRQ